MMIRYRCANVENSINLHKQVALLSNPARPTSQPSLHVQIEVAEQLLDRLEDCKRTFPVVAVLGGCGGPVLQRLGGGRAGIEQVIYLDSSREMLSCVKQKQQVSSKAPPSTSQQLASYACPMHSFWKNKRTQRWLNLPACLERWLKSAAPMLCGLCKGHMRRVVHRFPGPSTFREMRKCSHYVATVSTVRHSTTLPSSLQQLLPSEP